MLPMLVDGLYLGKVYKLRAKINLSKVVCKIFAKITLWTWKYLYKVCTLVRSIKNLNLLKHLREVYQNCKLLPNFLQCFDVGEVQTFCKVLTFMRSYFKCMTNYLHKVKNANMLQGFDVHEVIIFQIHDKLPSQGEIVEVLQILNYIFSKWLCIHVKNLEKVEIQVELP